MDVPVLRVFSGKRWIMDHQQVFRVPVLGRPGVIEAAGDDGRTVDDHDLVVHQTRYGIHEDRYAGGNKAPHGVSVASIFLKPIAPSEKANDQNRERPTWTNAPLRSSLRQSARKLGFQQLSYRLRERDPHFVSSVGFIALPRK